VENNGGLGAGGRARTRLLRANIGERGFCDAAKKLPKLRGERRGGELGQPEEGNFFLRGFNYLFIMKKKEPVRLS
jgi:hypothetical protein